jgi:hypothetical protein
MSSQPKVFFTDEQVQRVKAFSLLQKVLLKEKTEYLTVLYRRCGTGFTLQEFELIVQALVDTTFCVCAVGERGAITVSLNEHQDLPSDQV